jgi:hypothetical protein
MTEKTVQLEAIGEFPFNFYIEKAIAEETAEKELILEGVASTSNIDHDNERMSEEALHAMANVINEKSVPLRVEHSKSENAVIGSVFKAWVDDRNQLHIRARLDKSHPVSSILHSSMMENGKKMGFSVGGLVKRAVKEFSSSIGKLVKTFYDVELKEVSVTPRPANYDSWCISKSIATTEEEVEKSRGTAFYDEFLFANPQLDYLQAFAKSVPDEAWQKVNKTSMTIIKTEGKDKTEETADATKAVTRGEFATVVKGIGSLTAAFKTLVEKLTDDDAQDQHDPKEKKPDPEKVTAKAEDDTKDETATKAEEDAKDQANPDEKKPDPEAVAAKTSESDKTDEEKEKASDKTDDYKIETVERSIKSLEALTKRITGMKKAEDKTEDDFKGTEKAEDDKTDTKEKATDDEKKDETEKAEDEKEEETATKGMHPLDRYVAAVNKTIEAMVDKMEKSGINVLGFRKSVIDSIVNDSVAQKEIKEMMKVPGFKKSMSLGVPYMVTKEGKRYGLTATEVGAPTIEKSRSSDKARSFKDVYKSEYSSVRGQEE